MLFVNPRIPEVSYCRTRLRELPQIPAASTEISVLMEPPRFRQRLLELIATARRRIVMTLLYLQDDEAGREVLEALYARLQQCPKLEVTLYVDFHRAQRGLIGQEQSRGNSALYERLAAQARARGAPVPAIYGVPVKRREVFGVLHLKGCIFDDTVLYSGASLNNVYLGHGGRYRLDRYVEIKSATLADAMCRYAHAAFHPNAAVQDFCNGNVRPVRELRPEIRQLRRHLSRTKYTFRTRRPAPGQVGITPLSGLGKRRNDLNLAILWLLGAARRQIFFCTPYFNPPKPVLRAIEAALSRGVEVTVLVGDKIANDFFIRPGEHFSTIGAVPYIYEQNLRRFLTHNLAYAQEGRLKIRLWCDGNNTFHVKGLYIDNDLALLTGNNLNPRAFALDLENALLLQDPAESLSARFTAEQNFLLTHTKALTSPEQLQNLEDYPEPVQRVLARVRRFKANFLIERLL